MTRFALAGKCGCCPASSFLSASRQASATPFKPSAISPRNSRRPSQCLHDINELISVQQRAAKNSQSVLPDQRGGGGSFRGFGRSAEGEPECAFDLHGPVLTRLALQSFGEVSGLVQDETAVQQG